MSAFIATLPTVNVCLISSSGIAILVGLRFIHRQMRTAHKWAMLTAAALALLFLVFYILRIELNGTNAFHGPSGARLAYFLVLFSHIGIAVASTPLVGVVLYLGLRGKYRQHKKVARWTYPLWLYVSATGVLVYLFLYVLF